MSESQVVLLGGGCFWCIEAVFENIEGIQYAVSGYAGGNVINPSYQQVTSGATGHAEVVKLSYDPSKITFEEIIELFFRAHDPTTLNRQGADVGSQYRSVVFYYNEEQKDIIDAHIRHLSDTSYYENPIVTEVLPAPEFYIAESYHQDYYKLNPNAGYCQVVIRPKLLKLGLENQGN